MKLLGFLYSIINGDLNVIYHFASIEKMIIEYKKYRIEKLVAYFIFTCWN
jgi:hypothetical protein